MTFQPQKSQTTAHRKGTSEQARSALLKLGKAGRGGGQAHPEVTAEVKGIFFRLLKGGEERMDGVPKELDRLEKIANGGGKGSKAACAILATYYSAEGNGKGNYYFDALREGGIPNEVAAHIGNLNRQMNDAHDAFVTALINNAN
jgi:hypothetical protein